MGKLVFSVLALLFMAESAVALSRRYSYQELFNAADIVVLATPVQRKVLDPAAFLKIPGGDSIPVISVEARFHVRLGIKTVSTSDTVLVIQYHLHRGAPGVPIEQRKDVMIGNECGPFDGPIDSPVDFHPEDHVPYLMFLKRLGGVRYKAVDFACPSYCIQALGREMSTLLRR